MCRVLVQTAWSPGPHVIGPDGGGRSHDHTLTQGSASGNKALLGAVEIELLQTFLGLVFFNLQLAECGLLHSEAWKTTD